MAWTAPRDWTAGEVVTETMMDVHVRDNLQYLKDLFDGVQNQTWTPAYAATDANPVTIALRKARGTLAAPAIVNAFDNLGDILFQGHDGATYQTAARITVNVATGPGAGDMPGRMDFYTTPDGSATSVLNFRLGSAGQLQVGDGSAAFPVWTFLNDTDTGMWRSGANQLEFSVGGSSYFTLNTAGALSAQPMTVVSTAATTLKLNRFSSDGVLVDFMRDSSSIGSISVAGGVVAYNPFMGAHYTQLAHGQAAPPAGAVVVATGELLDGERDTYSRIDGTETPADPRVYGVWLGEVMAGGEGHGVGDPDAPISNVAGLGLHWCWVTDTGGDLAPGDLLETSARRWHAQRQADGAIRNSTLGKYVGPPIDWTTAPTAREDGFKRLRAPCVLYCG
jgi:hypothetical protein